MPIVETDTQIIPRSHLRRDEGRGEIWNVKTNQTVARRKKDGQWWPCFKYVVVSDAEFSKLRKKRQIHQLGD